MIQGDAKETLGIGNNKKSMSQYITRVNIAIIDIITKYHFSSTKIIKTDVVCNKSYVITVFMIILLCCQY